MTAPSRPARQVLDKAMNEDELLQAVTEALTLYGYTWCHWRRSDKALLMGTPGIADVIAARRGVVWFIELKSETGRLGVDQWAWIDALMSPELRTENREGPVRIRVWRPSDLDAALRELA